jgi:hypothetical protein
MKSRIFAHLIPRLSPSSSQTTARAFVVIEQCGEITALLGCGCGDAGERAEAGEEVGGFHEA